MATRRQKTLKQGAVPEAMLLDVRPDGVAVVTIDVPGESMNTLKAEFNDTFARLQDEIEGSDAIRAVVIISGKKDSFIAGADIHMLERAKTAAEAESLSLGGQKSFARLEASPVPIVAAIHGACLGGGLELALACHARVATDDAKTQLGLPECQLGLLPGAGGTQRLPRRIGIAAALDMMLTGRKLAGKAALKKGLVDEVVPQPILLEVAVARALKLADTWQKAGGRALDRSHGSLKSAVSMAGAQELALEKNPLGRKLLFQQARKNLLKTTRGNYPAHERIIDAVEVGYERGVDAGYAAEARFFGERVVSKEAEAMIGMYLGMTALKKASGVDDTTVTARAIHRVGILGAGLMGAGVAYVTVDKADIDVRMKDADEAGIARGLQQINKSFSGAVKRKKMTRIDASRQLLRVGTTIDYEGFARCDVVIEAVPEVLALKHRILAEVEALTGEDTIFASNTSSIPIASIAEASKRPHNVLGMHYFSPVEKMPLLEIIVTPVTSPVAVATAVELGKRQGKTVIVVNDGPGFYTSRILAPYMNEAAFLLTEGVAIDRIDSALVQWGYPVGPMTLLDEVGIDVASKVGPIMVDAFGSRMEPPGTTDALLEDGRLGRKAGKGLYVYGGGKKGKGKQVDASVYELLGVSPTNAMPSESIAERCALQMINEAALCMQDGVLRSARDGDIGAIFGLGFPPFRGGPFRYVDQVGASKVVDRLKALRDAHGLRFAPADLLVEMASKGRRFHES